MLPPQLEVADCGRCGEWKPPPFGAGNLFKVAHVLPFHCTEQLHTPSTHSPLYEQDAAVVHDNDDDDDVGSLVTLAKDLD